MRFSIGFLGPWNIQLPHARTLLFSPLIHGMSIAAAEKVSTRVKSQTIAGESFLRIAVVIRPGSTT